MISFIVPGQPIGKQRARIVRLKKTGRVVTFTPEQTVDYEAAIKLYARRAGVQVLHGPVGLVAKIFVRKARNGRFPDGTNVVKAIEDALNKVAYNDDRQIRLFTWQLDFDAARPRVEVELTDLTGTAP